jgi:pimeloyl-ACP methyl ester carboxylesterase
MLAVRSLFSNGYSPGASAEEYLLLRTDRALRYDRPPIVYCHGSGDRASTIGRKAGQGALLQQMAQTRRVIAPDLALQSFGNATAVARVEETRIFLGSPAKMILVAGSMGTLAALNYARLYPTRVAAIAGIIPATDLANSHAVATADVNAAYPPAYDDATMGPTWNPVQFAGALDPTIPIHLWTSNDDTIAWPSTAAAFVTARPQTQRTDIGAYGHTEAAVTASIPSVVGWLRDLP